MSRHITFVGGTASESDVAIGGNLVVRGPSAPGTANVTLEDPATENRAVRDASELVETQSMMVHWTPLEGGQAKWMLEIERNGETVEIGMSDRVVTLITKMNRHLRPDE